MREYEKVTIALTPEMAEAIAGAIKAGEFTSSGEVIRDALRMWMQHRKISEHRMKMLSEDIETGQQGWLLERLLNRNAKDKA
jgi:antitoxin ParD1/3/4